MFLAQGLSRFSLSILSTFVFLDLSPSTLPDQQIEDISTPQLKLQHVLGHDIS